MPVGAIATARVSGAESAGDLSCVVRGLDEGFICYPKIRRDGDDYLLEFPVEAPGLHVLSVSNGVEPVMDAVLAFDPNLVMR